MTETNQLVERYLELQDQISQLREQQETIKTALRELGTGTHPGPGGTKIRITPNNRFSEDQARAILTPELVTACSETIISSKKAREILAPALYRTLMVPAGEPRVSIL